VDSEAANELAQSAQMQTLSDPESDAAAFIKGVDPAVLKDLDIERVDLPMPDTYNTEVNLRNMKKTAEMYGADEAIDRVMLFELNGSWYFEGFTLLRYGGNWKVFNMSSPIAGTTATGSAMVTSKDEYMSLVS
jgi:hypothetical protein